MSKKYNLVKILKRKRFGEIYSFLVIRVFYKSKKVKYESDVNQTHIDYLFVFFY